MSEPSPAWPVAASVPEHPPAAAPPHLVAVPDAAPPSPFAPPSLSAADIAAFVNQSSPAAMLDVTAPLIDVPPAAAVLPRVSPAFDVEYVPAASPTPDAETVASSQAPATESEADGSPTVDPNTQWWSPVWALVLGMAAVMVQVVSFYAREQLPQRESSGQPLDQFDTIAGSLPLASGVGGMIAAVGIAVMALLVLRAGQRHGVREPVLQGLAAALAGLAIAGSVLLGMLFGP